MQYEIRMMYKIILLNKQRVIEPEPPRENTHRFFTKSIGFFLLGPKVDDWTAMYPFTKNRILNIELNWWQNEKAMKYIKSLIKAN